MSQEPPLTSDSSLLAGLAFLTHITDAIGKDNADETKVLVEMNVRDVFGLVGSLESAYHFACNVSQKNEPDNKVRREMLANSIVVVGSMFAKYWPEQVGDSADALRALTKD